MLRQSDARTGGRLVDVILDQAGSKGTGVWTVQNALGLGVPVSGIAEAVFARAVSSKPEQRAAVRAWCAHGPRCSRRTTGSRTTCARRCTPRRSSPTRRASTRSSPEPRQFGWEIDKGAIARIWRGGCIIRAQFLNRIVEAYEKNPDLATLLEDDYFADAVARGESAWRRVVSVAALSGVPVPGFASALAYYDSLASERLPAALVQAQRDFFGAHTYRRTDTDGRVPHALVRRPERGARPPDGGPAEVYRRDQRP